MSDIDRGLGLDIIYVLGRGKNEMKQGQKTCTMKVSFKVVLFTYLWMKYLYIMYTR